MKIASFVFVCFFASFALADDLTSVLVNSDNKAEVAPVVVAPSVVKVCCEEVRTVKVSPFTVRRLNRIADRQEARETRKEARKCCCDNCRCVSCNCCR